MSSLVAPNSIACAAWAIIVPATEAMHPHAEHAVGLGVGDDLHEAVGLVVGLGAAVGEHRELADLDLALLLGLLPRSGRRRRSRAWCRPRWDHIVVHDAGLAGDILGDRDALVLGLVGEHRAGDDVADRPDAGDLGAEVVVDLDLAALVELRARPCRGRGRRCWAGGRSRPARSRPRSSRPRRPWRARPSASPCRP